MFGLVRVNAASSASRSAGVYFDLNDDIRDGSCDDESNIELREMVSGEGAFRRPFMLPGRPYPDTFSGATAAIPGSGGNGLSKSTPRDVVLLNVLSLLGILGVRGIPSKTPAAVGEQMENAMLWPRSAGFSTPGSSPVKLDIDE